MSTDRPLHIVQLCADRGIVPGATKGAALHLRDLAAALARLGHHVTTLATRRPCETTPASSWPVALDQLAERGGLARQIDAYTVVYERYSLGHTAGLDAARRQGKRFVLEVNAPLVAEAQCHRPATVSEQHRAAERRLLREADAVVAVSEPLRQWCAAVRGSDKDTYAIANGFASERFGPPARAAGETPLVVFLGHPKPWHGAAALPTLIAALHERGVPARLRVIGGGAGTDAINDRAAELGVAGAIEITGAVAPERAAALLRDATIAVAPYPRHELFYFCPLKLIEYMAAGLATVTTDQGDIRRLVGDAAVCVAPDRPEAFVAAVAALCTDDRRRAALGRAARARAFAHFTWDHVAARVEAVLR